MAGDNYGNSGSAAFTWNVAYVNQAPTLENPGDQLNKTGDVVDVQLYGDDVDGDSVTYSATGLPSGLSINSTTGLISGLLPASAASSSPYSVTVTASDGTLTASQTFTWYVTGGVVTLTNPGDQTNTDGDTVSLQLSATDANNSTLTYEASGLPSGLSINSSTGLISGTVAAGDSDNGPYTVTVSATDSVGYSSYQQFTWTINAPNTLTLTNPGNQSNAEGDDVSLQLQASDPDGDTLEYAASGLPIGLSIDPTTGLISGTVDYSAAEISNGQYNVKVTVNDGYGQTVSQSFVWTITDTEQGPWLEYPEFQDSETGTSASLQLVGGSPDDKTLTYSATGLPTGLSINSSTGLIGGTITAAAGSYSVTATDTDTSNQSASQSFTWEVTSGPAPRVLLSFEDKPAGQDYLAGIGSGATIPVEVTLENASAGLHTIQISIPSGKSAVNLSSFQLADGGSESLELTPEEDSSSVDDVLLVAYVDNNEAGDAKGTNEDITFPAVIQNADTPTGMPPRIPKSNTTIATPIEVKLSVPLVKSGDAVTLEPNYYGPPAGWGTATGSIAFAQGLWPWGPLGPESTDKLTLKESEKVWLLGENQTAPGSAGNIGLVAGTGKGAKFFAFETSSKFSVASIPQNVTQSIQFTVNNQQRIGPVVLPFRVTGMVVKVSWESDSGNPKDLDQVLWSEQIEVDATKTTGVFVGLIPNVSGYQREPASVGRGTDLNVFKSSLIDDAVRQKKTSVAVANQVLIFTDKRTGAKDIPFTRSGFQITYEVKLTGGGRLDYVRFFKEGKDTTANKFSSKAGTTDPAKGLEYKP